MTRQEFKNETEMLFDEIESLIFQVFSCFSNVHFVIDCVAVAVNDASHMNYISV